MTHSYDDAAYFLDRADSRLSAGDVPGAVEAVVAAGGSLRTAPLRGLALAAHGYARSAVAALREEPPDAERARTYLQLCSRAVEEMAAYERAAVFESAA